MIMPGTHSIAGLAAMLGLIGLCAFYPDTFTPLAFAGAATAILAGIGGTTAAKAYQASVQAKIATPTPDAPHESQ